MLNVAQHANSLVLIALFIIKCLNATTLLFLLNHFSHYGYQNKCKLLNNVT